MKIIAYITLALVFSLARGADYLDTSEVQLRQNLQRSKVVFVLHWSEPANDYLMEQIKGFPEPHRFIPALSSWKCLTERIYADAFRAQEKPMVVVLMIEDREPKSECYSGITAISVSRNKNFGDCIHLNSALEIIRLSKTEK